MTERLLGLVALLEKHGELPAGATDRMRQAADAVCTHPQAPPPGSIVPIPEGVRPQDFEVRCPDCHKRLA